MSDASIVLVRSGQTHGSDDAYRQLAEVYNHLTSLALLGADVAKVTEILAQRIGQGVAVLEASLDPIAMSVPPGVPAIPEGWPVSDPRLARMLGALGERRRAVRLPAAGPNLPALVAGPITVAGEIVAYVVTFESSEPARHADFDLLVTEHAATVIAVVMSHDRALADVAGQVREDLIDALLVGRVRTADDRQRWAQHIGYHQDIPHRCVVIAIDSMDFVDEDAGAASNTASGLRRSVYRTAVRSVAARAPSAIVTARREEVVVLAPLDPRGPAGLGARKLADALAGQLSIQHPRLAITVGVGGVCSHVDQVSHSYEQALRAINAARSLGRSGRAVAFEDLGLFRLLLQVPQIEDLREFAREVFGDLLEYEKKHKVGMLRTLSAYLRHNGSFHSAGEELHVHKNTVRYRLTRIEEISGLHLDRYQDRLMAEVALTILEGLEPSLVGRKAN